MKKNHNVKGSQNNVTEMVFILNRSGSMSGLESDTIGGFNAMLRDQKSKEGEAYVTTVLFDSAVRTLHDRLPVKKVEELTNKDYTVGGCTALLDAIGETIRHIDSVHRYIRPEDVPQHTVFAITTDGMENASRNFSYKEIKKLIEKKKRDGWEFLFVAANIDAAEAAAHIGISEDRAVNYHADKRGTEVLYRSLNKAVSCMRAGAPVSSDWQAELQEDYDSRK